MRDFLEVNGVHTGDRLSLNLFGSPERTKDNQYAMSSSAKALSAGDVSENVVVPFKLKLRRLVDRVRNHTSVNGCEAIRTQRLLL